MWKLSIFISFSNCRRTLLDWSTNGYATLSVRWLQALNALNANICFVCRTLDLPVTSTSFHFKTAPCFQTKNLRWFLSLLISLFLSTRHNLAYINPLFGYAHHPARACPPTTTCFLPRTCACSLFIRIHLGLTCTQTQKLFNVHILAHERIHVDFFREG